MQIQSLRWYPYRVPLHAAFTTAHEKLGARDGIIVEIITDNNLSGLGECAPLPAFTHAQGDTLQDALHALARVRPQLLRCSVSDAFHMLQGSQWQLPPTVNFALETALLDILARQSRVPLYRLITKLTGSADRPEQEQSAAVHPPTIPVNAVIGAQTTRETIQQAQQAIDQGFHCLKIKIGTDSLEHEIGRIANVRAALETEVELRLDANEAFDTMQAVQLMKSCAHYRLQYIEQPLSRTQYAEMSSLRRRNIVPLAADEAVTTIQSAQQVLTTQAADILVIKPQLLGSLLRGRQLITQAANQNVQCVITSSLETGIGITAALHLAAASPEVKLACGLSTFMMLESDLLSTPLRIVQGQLAVPTEPGLDACIDRSALARYHLAIA